MLPLHAPPRVKTPVDRTQAVHAERLARLRGEAAPRAGAYLTLAFLIAGAVILVAVATLPAT